MASAIFALRITICPQCRQPFAYADLGRKDVYCPNGHHIEATGGSLGDAWRVWHEIFPHVPRTKKEKREKRETLDLLRQVALGQITVPELAEAMEISESGKKKLSTLAKAAVAVSIGGSMNAAKDAAMQLVESGIDPQAPAKLQSSLLDTLDQIEDAVEYEPYVGEPSEVLAPRKKSPPSLASPAQSRGRGQTETSSAAKPKQSSTRRGKGKKS